MDIPYQKIIMKYIHVHVHIYTQDYILILKKHPSNKTVSFINHYIRFKRTISALNYRKYLNSEFLYIACTINMCVNKG